MPYPEVAAWEAVRKRIAARMPEIDAGGARHDAANLENWRDLNSIFCPALAMVLCYIPRLYPLWPAHWHDYALRVMATGINVDLRGPRRRAKSSITRAHQLWKMLTLQSAFSTHVCLTPQLVLEHSTAVITELETNSRLQEAFHIHPGTIQRQEHFQIQVGNSHRTTLKFEWMTRDGDARGTGRNLVWLDDPDTDTDSPFMCEKYYGKFHASLLGTLEAYEGVDPQAIITCNLTGPYCNGILFEKRDAAQYPKQWRVITVPALEEGETQHITKTKPGESTWPERFTTEQTRDQINAMNMTRMRSGDMELQNKIADVGKMIWQREMFELRFDPNSVQPHQRVSRVYIDSSQKTSEAGDDWALGRITKVVDGPHRGEFWIEQVYADPLDPDSAIDIALDLFIGDGTRNSPQCESIKMESKTDKGLDPWLNDLQKTARRERGMYVSVGQIVASKDKRTRAVRAVPLGKARALRTPEVWDTAMDRMVEQMCAFTGESSAHLKAIDDLHDMVVHGLNDLRDVNEARTQTAPRRGEPIQARNKLRAVG